MADPCPRCQAPLPDAVGGAGERVCASCGNRTGVPPGSATVTLHAGGATSVYLPADTPGTGTTTTPAVMGPKASLSHVGLEGGVTLAPPREGSRSG
ncbi:MAG: hypothetical protein L6R48_20665, partial [Planctomycetes bacterium]|nr:hypothetical protein [Planctomycetota bacterium]